MCRVLFCILCLVYDCIVLYCIVCDFNNILNYNFVVQYQPLPKFELGRST